MSSRAKPNSELADRRTGVTFLWLCVCVYVGMRVGMCFCQCSSLVVISAVEVYVVFDAIVRILEPVSEEEPVNVRLLSVVFVIQVAFLLLAVLLTLICGCCFVRRP